METENDSMSDRFLFGTSDGDSDDEEVDSDVEARDGKFYYAEAYGLCVDEGSLCPGVSGVVADSHEKSAGKSLFVRVLDRSDLAHIGEMSVLGSWTLPLRQTQVNTCLPAYLPTCLPAFLSIHPHKIRTL